jgi:UDP-2-acetamido-2-deoxy-ribo-hexuluronate aminotransferase
MSDKITLFQTERTWAQIRDEVFALTDQYHKQGIAQNGEPAQLLETELAQRFNRKYCVVTASCTDALDLALQALKLPRNARVAVSNYTFTATAHAIRRAGYRVFPVDVTDNYTIDVNKIGQVDCVIPVDLFGNMSDWHNLDHLGIPLVNDAAQSLESNNWERWSASKGLISCVSFSPSKTISSWGSGGAILTDDQAIADLCRKLRLHGKTRNDDLAIGAGLNSIMSTMEVAAVLVGLKYSREWQDRRTKISEYIRSNCYLKSGNDSALMRNTYHKLVFQSDRRDELVAELNEQGIGAAVHYRQTVNDETLYQTKKSFPNSDRLKSISFTVPNQHTLTDAEVERIVKALK